MLKQHDHHLYASTKTAAQFILDLSVTISHVFTFIILLQLERTDIMWVIVLYLLAVTLALQTILAIGLLTLRLINNGHSEGSIPRVVQVLNDIFFWGCVFVAVLEVVIAVQKIFGLGHGPQDLHKDSSIISPSIEAAVMDQS